MALRAVASTSTTVLVVLVVLVLVRTGTGSCPVLHYEILVFNKTDDDADDNYSCTKILLDK